MLDEFTSTTDTSFKDRISGSLGGIMIGIMLFVAAFPLLWWNEGRSLHRFQTLDEGRNLVVAVPADQINPDNNHKLIYVTGNATTSEILNDKLFGVSVNALKLNRVVEIYQWVESQQNQEQNNLGGSKTQTTTYSYQKTWVPNLINSSAFKHPQGHENTGSMPYSNQLFIARDINLGAFKLANNFISQMTWSVRYPLTEQNADAMSDPLKNHFKLNNGEYFYGDNPNDPQIGAIRVYYTTVQPDEVSIIGKQDNQQIGCYHTHSGDLALLEKGTVSADSMFADAETNNSLLSWAIRAGGFALMLGGLAMIVRPISVLSEFVPILGSIVNVGLGSIISMIAFICSITTIGIAWVAYRPLIGGSLLAAALIILFGGIGFIIKKMKALKTKPVQRQSSVIRAFIILTAPMLTLL